MLATISYYPLFNFLKKHIQKTYFVTTKKNDSKLNVFFKKIVTKLSLNQLSNEVISILEHKLNINVISFYFYDYSTDTYDLVKSKKSSASKIKFEAMQQILNNVKYYKTLIYHKFINFNSNLKNLLEQSNIEIVLPLIFDKVFLGCILLSPKKDKTDYSYENLEFLRQITYYSSMAISNLVRYNALKNSYWNSVRALANAIEAKDIYTCGHSERVVKYSLIIGKKMNLSTKELDKLKFGGILHDIGKIAIDDEILKKNSALTEIEKEIIKSHPLEGENIISPISFLEEIKPIVRHHHERWDGTGYPDRLFKERIPLLARIVQLADTFDAITTSRVYRNKRNFDTAVEEIQRCSGSQFDPTIVYYFLKAYSDGLITEEATKYKLL
jgi:putative nucleotidyltransferase with HDIG domain